jgi:hypothetical protein
MTVFSPAGTRMVRTAAPGFRGLDMERFTVQDVRPAPHGFSQDAIALVTFTFVTELIDGPVIVHRWDKKSEVQRPLVKVACAGAMQVQVIDAVLAQGKHGSWLQTGNVDVPRDVAAGVAKAAEQRLGMKPASQPDDDPQFSPRRPATAGA